MNTHLTTIAGRAEYLVPGFLEFSRKIQQRATIGGRSSSLITCYIRELAKLSLKTGRTPIELTEDEINEYLYEMLHRLPLPSKTTFKFVVFALRFAYRTYNMDAQRIALPKFKCERRLPVVLSREEVRRMIDAASLFKHKVLIMLLYGCGLRRSEVQHLKREHLDFDRGMLMVKQGKGRKDRYVPMAGMLMEALKKYLKSEKKGEYVFSGRLSGKRQGAQHHWQKYGIRWPIEQAARKSNILKPISVHTLRHTYATHLLEDGLDIVSIKELLGHSNLSTTTVYLHVARFDSVRAFSPLDNLYPKREMTACPSANICQNFLAKQNPPVS